MRCPRLTRWGTVRTKGPGQKTRPCARQKGVPRNLVRRDPLIRSFPFHTFGATIRAGTACAEPLLQVPRRQLLVRYLSRFARSDLSGQERRYGMHIEGARAILRIARFAAVRYSMYAQRFLIAASRYLLRSDGSSAKLPTGVATSLPSEPAQHSLPGTPQCVPRGPRPRIVRYS